MEAGGDIGCPSSRLPGSYNNCFLWFRSSQAFCTGEARVQEEETPSLAADRRGAR